MDWPGSQTALITGASSGIGLELARLCAADGFDLVLVARDRERLEHAAANLRAQHHVSVRCEARDLSDAHAALDLWTELRAAGITVDVLINNAGFGLYGSFAEQDSDELERMLQLNMLALTTLTRLALSGMVERRRGRVLNVASVVAYQPGGPRMAAYYATKAYVLSFSKGVARELDGSGVSVTALCPGPTDTLFDDRSRTAPNVSYKRFPKMTAAAVARAGYRGMKRQSMVVIPGFLTKILAFLGELPPRRIALEVNRLFWQPRNQSADDSTSSEARP
jgi:uncharacterized protein